MTVHSRVIRTQGRADARLADLAAKQHGVFTRAQARTCGFTDAMADWRVRTAAWKPLHKGVYTAAGSPRTWHQRALAACLYLDGVISHRSAAFMRGAPAIGRGAVEITVPRRRHRRPIRGIVIHSPIAAIHPSDITTIDAIPTTRPERTLADLATVVPERTLEICLDNFLKRKLVSMRRLKTWLGDTERGRNVRGASTLRRLLALRPDARGTDSSLETDMLRFLRARRFPPPKRQYGVWDGDRFIGHVDLAYPEQRIAIELDGFEHHDTRLSFDYERARANDLQAIDWTPFLITHQHLLDGDRVERWLRKAWPVGTDDPTE